MSAVIGIGITILTNLLALAYMSGRFSKTMEAFEQRLNRSEASADKKFVSIGEEQTSQWEHITATARDVSYVKGKVDAT